MSTSRERRGAHGEIVDSGMQPVEPDWRLAKVDWKELIDEAERPAEVIFA
jgi:hypothetical protein